MSIKALSDYTFNSRYAQYLPKEKRRENWGEAVKRVFAMHREKYSEEIKNDSSLLDDINFAEKQVLKKRVLASQRSLQFGGDPIFKHELKMFNCLTTYVDRGRVFQEMMYALLCGCGVGFSVQKFHVNRLPKVSKPTLEAKSYVIEDSIEGWADAVGVLMASWFISSDDFSEYSGHKVEFDYSNIRPEGSLIANRFKAPGPDGLKDSILKMEGLLNSRVSKKGGDTKLRPIDCYDLVMHISNAVLSGGVRRSATLCMFSHNDEEMIKAKTGDWFVKNPQRARSNNSVVLLKDSTTKEEFSKLMESTKQFGEPGFIWVDDLSIVYNPCCEISMVPKLNGESGWEACNLTEINGKYCDTKEKFMKACRASAIIGTLQAGYTNLKYFKDISKDIFEKEALLGCSITGMMDNPDVLFDKGNQKDGAKTILKVNLEISKKIGINPCARATCVKPAGSTSCVLGTASGIHPQHSRRYFRRTQVNRSEFCGKIVKEKNPISVEKSVWSANGTDNVISFLCEVPSGAIIKNQLSALDLLEKVRITQQNWVEYGTVESRGTIKELRHNVSNTISVKDDEWKDVEDYIYRNRGSFAGISLLSSSGDLDYPQAPFATVLNPSELVKEYGDASVFASGLVVDGLHAFSGNLWKGCDTALGFGDNISEEISEPTYPAKRSNKLLVEYFEAKEKYEELFLKKDWVRRVVQFADRYFNGDVKKSTYCMKHVSLWKSWCDQKREYVDVDWQSVVEEDEQYENANELGAQACAGGACEIQF